MVANRSTLLVPVFAAGLVLIVGPRGSAQEVQPRSVLAPPQSVVDAGNEAPLIRYNRYLSGGAHTNGAFSGGWQITHALAAWAGNTAAYPKLLEQISYNLEGENVISANGGYPAQHELHMTGTYAILRHAPDFWDNALTGEQRRKIDLVMKAALVASAYTTSDATYVEGATPTAIDGDTNLHRTWNPNYREGMFGALLAATVYFGGVDRVYEILNGYDHDVFVAELAAAGLTNIHETFTWAEAHPESGAPDGDRIEQNIRNYTYRGEPLMEPMVLYHTLTMHTYGRQVQCGLNDGAGIPVDGVPTGTLASGCESLPNRGVVGMLLEFDSVDAEGPRSSIVYAYDGFRPNLTNHVVLLAGGFWRSGEMANEILRTMDVGITDLRYKLEHGYRNYSRGRGSTTVYDLGREQYASSFRTTLPLWYEVIRPYHVSTGALR